MNIYGRQRPGSGRALAVLYAKIRQYPRGTDFWTRLYQQSLSNCVARVRTHAYDVRPSARQKRIRAIMKCERLRSEMWGRFIDAEIMARRKAGYYKDNP